MTAAGLTIKGSGYVDHITWVRMWALSFPMLCDYSSLLRALACQYLFSSTSSNVRKCNAHGAMRVAQLQITRWEGQIPFSAECRLCGRLFSLFSVDGMTLEDAVEVLKLKFGQHICAASEPPPPNKPLRLS